VVDNLSADVILGLDFLKMHCSTTFVTGGLRKPIRVGDQKVCSVAAANFKPPRIFSCFRSCELTLSAIVTARDVISVTYSIYVLLLRNSW